MSQDEHPSVIVNVDDNEPTRYARTRILQRAGFIVHEAGTGAEAFRMIAEHRPDLVTLDVHLPDVNGIEVCRQLKADPSNASLVIVQISASAVSAPHATSALNNGADAYLTEPVDPDVFVATVRAMLRLRKAERDLAHANKVLANLNQELVRSNEDLKQFAFMASHDLREPLRMVNAYSQLLLKRFSHLTDPDVIEYAGFVREGVARMEMLIHNVLYYSHAIHADQDELRVADLSKSCEDAVAILSDTIRETHATVTFDALPVLPGSQEQLGQVFQNLIANALKYGKDSEPVQVRISARHNGTDWVISVRDNGIGFEPEYAEHIFGLFKRLHRSEYPGTGVGLAICKRIIQRHGGDIWAESTPGGGATFSFSLPGDP